MTTDPISDLLTRIRNGILSRKVAVEVPGSKLKTKIAEILRDEGYIGHVSVKPDGKQGTISVDLKWQPDRRSVIVGLRRVSKPGRRVYCKAKAVPKVRNGLGVAVLSTSRGVMTARAAAEAGVGGEVLCEVW